MTDRIAEAPATKEVPTEHPKTWINYLRQHEGDVFLPLGDSFISGKKMIEDELEAHEEGWGQDDDVSPDQWLHRAQRVYIIPAIDEGYLHLCSCHQHIVEDAYTMECEEV